MTAIPVVIVGAGPGGLCMGLRMLEEGVGDFVILEASDGIGGTWWHNRYPGAACDTKADFYSYSFAPADDWPREYAAQPQMQAYLQRVAERSGVLDHVRLGTRVTDARWDDERGRWDVWIEGGERIEAEVVVSAVGTLNVPKVPDLPGLESFAGRSFHSARWDDEAPVLGQRVGVIGSGASAVQIVPSVAGDAEHLTVFQRSPGWVLPKADGPARRRRGLARRWRRMQIFLKSPTTIGFSKLMRGTSPLRETSLELLQKQVHDPATRAALTPDYPFGCKRLLISSEYLPTFNRPDVSLVTSGIGEIVPEGVRTADGTLHELDVLVLATGFEATDYLSTLDVTGRGGRKLRDVWSGGAYAYLGMTVPGFPNLFLLYGPNTNQGSIIFMIESQVEHILRLMKGRRRGAFRTIEADERRTGRYNKRLERSFAQSVWNSCSNYYTTATGRIPTQYPWSCVRYWLATRVVRSPAYVRR